MVTNALLCSESKCIVRSEDPTFKTNPGTWPSLWGTIMKDIAADTPSRNRVFVDLLNEPDHAGLTWNDVSLTLCCR